MRKLLPNLDREDGLDTVLEVPIPEEIFNPMDGSTKSNSWSNVKTWMKCSQVSVVRPAAPLPGAGGDSELPLLLNVVGAPLIPLPVQNEQPPNDSIKNHPIGLDPRTTASLFSNAVCIGEKLINNEGCFI
ncbi:uncharacterized protein LOC116261247 [Nymphaea colorata]|nr:uncharacterized protein LOC116261247 [Nymphaea colorata]